METDQDHVHILLEYCPNTSVSDIVKQLKQYSTYQMWKYHEDFLSKQYWKHRKLWSNGYFACSIGQASQNVIEKYIQNQGWYERLISTRLKACGFTAYIL